MARTITVKGIGKVSAKPDYVVFSMTLKSKHKDYDKAMDMAADHIQQLNETLCGIGFEKDSVKTTNFSVRTDYDRVKDRNGNYQSVFRGYEVTHNLKLAFDFDMGRLSQALSTIAGCLSHPQLSVAFTVKDATATTRRCFAPLPPMQRKKPRSYAKHPALQWVTSLPLTTIGENWISTPIPVMTVARTPCL